MKLLRDGNMINNYAHDVISAVLTDREIKLNILNAMKENSSLTVDTAKDILYSLALEDKFKENYNEKIQEAKKELNELIDDPKSFKGVNEQLFDIVSIEVEDWHIFIEGNNISFILPYPTTFNEIVMTIAAIKNYLQIAEELIFYQNYSKEVEEVIKTGKKIEINNEGIY